jgi:replicative DNA helicase
MTWDWKGLHEVSSVAELATRLHEQPTVVPFGVPSMDRHLWYWGDRRGIPRGEYVILAGASNSGKTQLGLHMLKQAAAAGESAAILSLEMQREDLLLRLYQGISGIDPKDWSPSKWTSGHTRRLEKAVRDHGDSIKGEIRVNGGYTADLESILREMRIAIDQGVTFFVLDHLQLVRVKGYGADQVTSRVEIAGEELRRVAFENRVTLCALSQLTIGASRDHSRSPDMYSLWGGMAVGSNASLVVLCDHTLYERVDGAPHQARTWLNLSKNRMGPKGIAVPVLWDHASLTLHEALPHEEYQWPTHKTD